MASERPTCGTCPYWHQVGEDRVDYDDDGPTGVCLRFPPVYVGRPSGLDDPIREPDGTELRRLRCYYASDTSWSQPWTDARNDTCGEHPDFPAWMVERNSSRAAGVAPDFVVPRDWQHLSIRAITALEKLIGDRERLPVAEVDGEIPWYVRGCGVTTKREILEWLAERKEGKP